MDAWAVRKQGGSGDAPRPMLPASIRRRFRGFCPLFLAHWPVPLPLLRALLRHLLVPFASGRGGNKGIDTGFSSAHLCASGTPVGANVRYVDSDKYSKGASRSAAFSSIRDCTSTVNCSEIVGGSNGSALFGWSTLSQNVPRCTGLLIQLGRHEHQFYMQYRA